MPSVRIVVAGRDELYVAVHIFHRNSEGKYVGLIFEGLRLSFIVDGLAYGQCYVVAFVAGRVESVDGGPLQSVFIGVVDLEILTRGGLLCLSSEHDTDTNAAVSNAARQNNFVLMKLIINILPKVRHFFWIVAIIAAAYVLAEG